MANRLLVLALFVSCSPIPVTPTCSTDPECGAGAFCDDGVCRMGLAGVDPDDRCTEGQSRPCGPSAVGACRPGVQNCVAGIFETACAGESIATTETCNAIDDDCDGTVDEGTLITFFVDRDGDGFGSNASGAETQLSCTPVAGFVTNDSDCNDTRAAVSPAAFEVCDPADIDEDCDGMANESCGCSNVGMTQACCAGRGAQTCEARDGGATLSSCTVAASPEVCNAIDDDCDGVTDELYATTAPDGGVLVLADGGVIELDGGCTVGVGACARTAATMCSGGSLSCAAVAGSPSTELCNNLDDDCDGQIDEASTGLCAATGQSCAAGTCQCPSGQAVCGSSCQTLGGTCSAGVGACLRTGAIACISGGASCNATSGTPTAETCDGIDNDCDGSTDEGVTVTCLVDADNDRASPGTATSQQCPDTARASWGSCPSGFVSPGAALNTADCNDALASVYQMAATFADADGDRHCAGPQTPSCIGTAPPAGRLEAASCTSTSDCNDANANAWILGMTRSDADGDFFCVGPQMPTCNGTNPPAGRVFPNNCTGFGSDDCNDSDQLGYFEIQVRADADNDGYCVGSTVPQCGNGTPTTGTRAATSCQGTDCRDVNAQATTTCYLAGAYQTAAATKECGFGPPPTETKTATGGSCPSGFSRILAPYSGSYAGNPGGNCTATSNTTLTMSCGSLTLGSFSCRVIGDCSAN